MRVQEGWSRIRAGGSRATKVGQNSDKMPTNRAHPGQSATHGGDEPEAGREVPSGAGGDSVVGMKGLVAEFVEMADQGFDLIPHANVFEQLALDLADRVGDRWVISVEQATDVRK